jgi:putative membrane protein
MNAIKSVSLALAGAAAVALAQAQTPPSDTGTAADPSAASSPHQRDATGRQTTEAPATGSPEASSASTPHQRETTGADSKGDAHMKMAMKDAATPASFVKHAAQDGMTEVELGKVAMSKSQDPAIRKFAERMVQDHGKANTELTSIAKRKGLDVPAALDSEHQAMVQALSSKSGAAFDSAYAKDMDADHSKAIALFEAAAKSDDADIASFAKKTLPTLKEHKKMADALPAGSHSASAAEGTPRRQ